MTWRERIAVARQRGKFSRADHRMWQEPLTCPVGEVTVALMGEYDSFFWGDLNEATDGSVGALTALLGNDFNELERIMDILDDAGLRLKRKGQR